MTAPQSPALPSSGSLRDSGLPSHKHRSFQASRFVTELVCGEQAEGVVLHFSHDFRITCDDLAGPDGVWAEVPQAAHIYSTYLVTTQRLAVTRDRATDALLRPTQSTLLLCLHMFETREAKHKCWSPTDGLRTEGSRQCSSGHSRPPVRALHRWRAHPRHFLRQSQGAYLGELVFEQEGHQGCAAAGLLLAVAQARHLETKPLESFVSEHADH